MVGPGDDPDTFSAKLDRTLTLLDVTNTCLDDNDVRLARMETV
jgi:hypothetical protein